MFPFGDDLLAIYLQDHYAGSVAGSELAHRARGQNAGTDLGRFLADLEEDIEEDRDALQALMARLDVGTDRLKNAVAWTGEKVGRLKLNGRLTSYSPLSALVELEGLIAGVNAKLGMWRALRAIADDDPRLDPAELERLAARAERQLSGLWEHHREVSTAALAD